MKLEGFKLIGHDCPYGEYPAPVVPVGVLAGDRVVVYPAGNPSQRVQPVGHFGTFVRHSSSLTKSLKHFDVTRDRLFAFREDQVQYYSIREEEDFLRAFLDDARYRECSPGIRNMLARHLGELAPV